MPQLIASLSTGKGTWGHVSRLIEDGEWDKVILITNEFGKENFKKDKKTEFIVIDSNKSLQDLIADIQTSLKEKITEQEIALNLVSGTGKEHMAILSSLLKLGVAIRLIALTKNGIEEI